MKILVIKIGAMGDVVRTSYILAPLHAQGHEVWWVTSESAIPLLGANPFIAQLIPFGKLTHSTHSPLAGQPFDWVVSLDDENEACQLLREVRYSKLTGAYLTGTGAVSYTEDSAPWFDMGLISRLGKARADALKKKNQLTHDQIFSRILDLPPLRPQLFVSPASVAAAVRTLGPFEVRVGLNLSAGGRWPSKRLLEAEAINLVKGLHERGEKIALLGAGADRPYLRVISEAGGCPILPEVAPDVFASLIGQLDAIITTDSLGLHLGIAQKVPSVSFFAPTSAVEINTFGLGEKVASLSSDYCSYQPQADNRTLTAGRVLEAFDALKERIQF